MAEKRQNKVFKGLHKPLTYFGVERSIFFTVCFVAVLFLNIFNSLLAALVVFVGGQAIGYWVTNADPAFLKILGKGDRFKPRYDAAKQQVPNVEIR